MNQDKTPMNILLADDDEDDRTFFNDAIKELKMNNKLTIFKNITAIDPLNRHSLKTPMGCKVQRNNPKNIIKT